MHSAFYFLGISINSTMDRLLLDDKLRESEGANFDQSLELQMAKHSAIGIAHDRIECNSFPHRARWDHIIHSVCALQIAPNSDDEDVASLSLLWCLH